jgi:hypothetical protein
MTTFYDFIIFKFNLHFIINKSHHDKVQQARSVVQPQQIRGFFVIKRANTAAALRVHPRSREAGSTSPGARSPPPWYAGSAPNQDKA